MLGIFTFVKNFSDANTSKLFLTDKDGFREVSAQELTAKNDLLITHDYWMICEEIRNISGGLPLKVLDLDEFRIFIDKNPKLRKEREKLDSIYYINNYCPNNHSTTSGYKKIFYAEDLILNDVIQEFHQLMLTYYVELCRMSVLNGEFKRFFDIELPCQRICADISARGIPIKNASISDLRASVDHEYYIKLKNISDEFDVPLEVPTFDDIKKYALVKNVDIEEYSINFIMNYIPQIRNYMETVLELRNLDLTRGVLNSVAVKADRVHPIVDTQGSRTSRISVRNPFLQNLPKRYRSLIISDRGKQLCYVDFGQFEVGIMAALSHDPNLLALYAEADMYETFRLKHLNGEGDRKAAKILFLAYAYGMKRKHLPLVGASFAISRETIRTAFKDFSQYEIWKQNSLRLLDADGFVSTSFGNRFYKKGSRATNKEKLSAISQIVQGEGSLIFKKTLLRLAQTADVEILLPMHDAVLFQHERCETPNSVKLIFEEVMTEHFDRTITGKASVDDFYA